MNIEIDLPSDIPLEEINKIAKKANVDLTELVVSNTIRTIKISATSPEQLYNFGFILGCEITKSNLSKPS